MAQPIVRGMTMNVEITGPFTTVRVSPEGVFDIIQYRVVRPGHRPETWWADADRFRLVSIMAENTVGSPLGPRFPDRWGDTFDEAWIRAYLADPERPYETSPSYRERFGLDRVPSE